MVHTLPASPAPARRSRRSRGPTHTARVRVEWLEADLLFAHCVDDLGRRYVIDQRSAVSLSALAEGMALDVVAWPSGLVKQLAFDD